MVLQVPVEQSYNIVKSEGKANETRKEVFSLWSYKRGLLAVVRSKKEIYKLLFMKEGFSYGQNGVDTERVRAEVDLQPPQFVSS
jgi:hypothetical protein